MGSKITVIVNLDRSGRQVVVCTELDKWIVESMFEPMDKPSNNAGAFAQMCCTDHVIIRKVMRARSEFADALAHQLKHALLEAMCAGDTRMGYEEGKQLTSRS